MKFHSKSAKSRLDLLGASVGSYIKNKVIIRLHDQLPTPGQVRRSLLRRRGSKPRLRRPSHLADADFDLFWTGGLALGDMHSKHAILELGIYLVGIGVVR
jgi:hypothetical protein